MKVYLTAYFKRQLKELKRHYPHVADDLLEALEHSNLKTAIHIGGRIYKIRIKSRDLQKGKSGGFRSYIYIYQESSGCIPLCIYAKSQKESIGDNELQCHVDRTNLEIFIGRF